MSESDPDGHGYIIRDRKRENNARFPFFPRPRVSDPLLAAAAAASREPRGRSTPMLQRRWGERGVDALLGFVSARASRSAKVRSGGMMRDRYIPIGSCFFCMKVSLLC